MLSLTVLAVPSAPPVQGLEGALQPPGAEQHPENKLQEVKRSFLCKNSPESGEWQHFGAFCF